MSKKLLDLQLHLSEYVEGIRKLFPPGMRVTIVVRNPTGSTAGVMIGNDTVEGAIEELNRQKIPVRVFPGNQDDS